VNTHTSFSPKRNDCITTAWSKLPNDFIEISFSPSKHCPSSVSALQNADHEHNKKVLHPLVAYIEEQRCESHANHRYVIDQVVI